MRREAPGATPGSVDSLILRALQAAAVNDGGGNGSGEGHVPAFVAAAKLAADCGIDATELRRQIAELRAAGYTIDETAEPGDSGSGFRLRATPDRLIAADIAARLDPGCLIGREVLVFEATRSTNDVAARLGRDGSAEGAIVFAETQTAGRGRLGRRWDSARGEGLWFSVLLRPRLPLGEWARLTIWAAVAVCRGIEDATGVAGAMIKWPNDIYISGKKIVGILIESHLAPASARSSAEASGFAVAGIGVNVNQTHFSRELSDRAGSLRSTAAGGRALDRQAVAAAILRRLDVLYPAAAGDFPSLLRDAEARNFLRGRWIEAETSEGRVAGVAGSLGAGGELQLRNSEGALLVLSSGEVRLLSKAGFW